MRVKNPDQKFLIKALSKKIEIRPNDLVDHLIELGIAFCVVTQKPEQDRQEVFDKWEEMYKSHPKLLKIHSIIYESWEAGAENPEESES